ncbi:putative acetyltransferase [Microbulbifer donghaiensis]|uniref:Putative acetyltransferase n=1 Tax=Microbulbifer donghaiensis TaxID=494016 RepID=A0A1M5APW2_9GAMM|nr:GNAT family N-acetyltransferase [Microbulbifer donghaiensis]SHF32214.1 putative acetyltransferase [Microbulbifer donghaiensis]
MIRSASDAELDRLEQLWLHTAASAHPSLPQDYWRRRIRNFRRDCRRAVDCLVYLEGDGEPVSGFVTVTEGDRLGCICVSPLATGRGVGSELIDAAKRGRPQLQVEVLEENLGARYFLQQQGFVEVERRPDTEAGQVNIRMCCPAPP